MYSMNLTMSFILITTLYISFIVIFFNNIKLLKKVIFFQYFSLFEKILLGLILLVFISTSYYIGNRSVYYTGFISYIGISLPFIGSGISENGLLHIKGRSSFLIYKPFSDIDKVIIKKRNNYNLVIFYGCFANIKFKYSKEKTKDIIVFLKSKNMKVVDY